MYSRECKARMRHKRSSVIRRSVALPEQLVREALALAPPESAGNLNRLVADSLAEFIARKNASAFEDAMAAMAADPAIRKECVKIAQEFAAADRDGLERD
jgi:hypothetical protein